MDKLAEYRQLIMKIIEKHAKLTHTSQADVESQTVFDKAQDRYMLFRVGWHDHKRINTPFLYVQFKNGKIWIEEDWTEDGIAGELLAAHVPREDIVLGFRHPNIRSYTEFAMA